MLSLRGLLRHTRTNFEKTYRLVSKFTPDFGNPVEKLERKDAVREIGKAKRRRRLLQVVRAQNRFVRTNDLRVGGITSRMIGSLRSATQLHCHGNFVAMRGHDMV